MKKTFLPPFVALALLLPTLAFATVIGDILNDLTGVVIILIEVLLGLAVLVFFWGIVKFISNAGDEKAIEEGKQLMLWGMIAIFVMVALWGIIGWLQAQLGLDTVITLSDVSEQPTVIPVP